MVSWWKAIKWATYTLLSGVLVKLVWKLWQNRAQAGPELTLAILASAVCAVSWLIADRKEVLERLARLTFFVRSETLTSDDVLISSFHPYFQGSTEASKAQKEFSTKGRLLILGRPAGGKTRLAYKLAKEAEGHWVLILRPGFSDWKSLTFPKTPPRCKAVWLIDDLDKFIGRFDFVQVARVLKEQCELKMIATCRQGQELEAVLADKELASFAEALLPGVRCPDFSEKALLELAKETNRSPDSAIYDGTPGSVTLGLAAMKRRLQAATPGEQALMKAMFLMRTAFIYSPSPELAAAVFSDIFKLKRAEEKVEAAVESLRRDGFLRADQLLVPTHDCYLTPEFFRYYPAVGSTLQKDLLALGKTVVSHGTLSDHNSLGVFWSAKEEYGRALPFFEKAAEENLNDDILGFNLGVVLFKTGKTSEALRVFKGVVASNPYHLEALCNLALIQTAAGVPGDESLTTIRKLSDVYNLYRATGEPSSKTRRSIAGVFALKGRVLSDLGRNEDAIKAYDDVLLRFGSSDPPLDQPIADALFGKGVALLNLHRQAEAIRTWNEVLTRFEDATDPNLRKKVAMAAVNMGSVLIDGTLIKEAVQVLSDMISRFGEDGTPGVRVQVAEALVHLGYALNDREQREEAIRMYDHVLARFGDAEDPGLTVSTARALVQKSFVLSEQKKLEQAVRTCDEVLRRFANSDEAKLKLCVAEALAQKGVFLVDLNREEQALSLFRNIVERFDHSVEPKLKTWVSLARSYQELAAMGQSKLAADAVRVSFGLHKR